MQEGGLWCKAGAADGGGCRPSHRDRSFRSVGASTALGLAASPPCAVACFFPVLPRLDSSDLWLSTTGGEATPSLPPTLADLAEAREVTPSLLQPLEETDVAVFPPLSAAENIFDVCDGAALPAADVLPVQRSVFKVQG